MSEMNTPKDSRALLGKKLDGILTSNPNDLCAAALKEAVSDLSAAKAEQILTLLNAELSGVKGTGADPSLEISKKVAPYIEWFKHPNYEFRLAAARELGEIKDPSALPALTEALKDESYDVRQAAARALGRIEDPRAVPALCEALKDNSYVQRAAAEALGRIKDPSSVEPLIGALKDERGYVRLAAAEALGEIKDPRAVPQLIEALKDKDWWVRKQAARALGEIGDKSAITPLKARLRFLGIFGGEMDSDNRATIKKAINKLERN